MITDQPLVSVVIAAFDAASFIDGAVKSALEQTGVTLEVLIVDDRSRDTTRAVIAALAHDDKRIVVIHSPVNTGPAGARNLAIEQARGDWIAILDSDDRFAPNRLNQLIQTAIETESDIVVDDFLSVNSDGIALDAACLADRRGAGYLDIDEWIGLNTFAFAERSFGYAKPILKRSFLERATLRYNPALRNGEDFHLILAALIADAAVYFTAQQGYIYTRRAGSVSGRAQDDHMRALIAADDAVFVQLASQTRSRSCDLLSTRRKNLKHLIVTEAVLGNLKARRPLRAIGHLLRHPRATGRVISHLKEALSKRILPV